MEESTETLAYAIAALGTALSEGKPPKSRPSGQTGSRGVTRGTVPGIPIAFQSCRRTCLWYLDVITAEEKEKEVTGRNIKLKRH